MRESVGWLWCDVMCDVTENERLWVCGCVCMCVSGFQKCFDIIVGECLNPFHYHFFAFKAGFGINVDMFIDFVI